MPERMIGVIGGTGLGQALWSTTGGEEIHVDTPFGPPSSPITLTEWEGQKVAILPRHGSGHVLNPTEVPFRANIYALKKLGVTHIIASGATGSLREEIQPRDLVIADQVIDKTYKRDGTFFDSGLAAHVEFAQPFCGVLRRALLACAEQVETQVHDGGVYVCMEGPQFSTVAESRMHRVWGGDVIGMTCMPEAKLAREAEICYALVALPTDYDCWRPHDPGKDQGALLEEIVHNLEIATQHAIQLIQRTIAHLANQADTDCTCSSALKLAIFSDKDKLEHAKLAHLKLLLEKYIAFGD
ncbi:MAG: S-methyl-5'-thioadenosine phosphorylase [Planctomycetes bacterium]|nr:S-methyl-5'-thioadenosine phosphorylase [Planctomycetota bacterium]